MNVSSLWIIPSEQSYKVGEGVSERFLLFSRSSKLAFCFHFKKLNLRIAILYAVLQYFEDTWLSSLILLAKTSRLIAWSSHFILSNWHHFGNSCARGYFCPNPRTECPSSGCLCLEKNVAYMGNNIVQVSQLILLSRLGAISNCQLQITSEVIANDPITNYFTKKVMGNAPNYPLLFGYISNWISSW